MVWQEKVVSAICFLACMTLSVNAQCNLNVALGQEWYEEGASRVASQLNFTGDGVPAPWFFTLRGNFTEDAVPWHWSVLESDSNMVSGAVTGYWQYVNDTPIALGAILSSEQIVTDDFSASLNGQECSVNVTKLPSATASASVEGSGSPQPMKTSDGQLIGVNGQVVKLVGVNWFGWINGGNSFFDGLWQGPTSLTNDYATVVYRLQLLGVNSVRVVFSFQNLFGGTPTVLAGNCVISQQSDIQNSVYNPATPSGWSLPPPNTPSSLAQPAGTCNTYLPSDTVLNAFVTSIRLLASSGMYIILDNQSQSDRTVLDDTSQWIQYWTTLMTTFWQQPETAAYIIVDAFNEPDSLNIKFEPAGGLPGAHQLYVKLWDAIYAQAPNTMFGFEGLGQGSSYVQNWVITFSHISRGMLSYISVPILDKQGKVAGYLRMKLDEVIRDVLAKKAK